MMSKLNSPYLAALVLAGLVWLAMYSLNQKAMASSEEADAFIMQKLSEYRRPQPVSDVQVLYDLWNLTEADVSKPVDLFNEGEKL